MAETNAPLKTERRKLSRLLKQTRRVNNGVTFYPASCIASARRAEKRIEYIDLVLAGKPISNEVFFLLNA